MVRPYDLIGAVRVENPHNESYGQPDYQDELTVTAVDARDGFYVELNGGEIAGCYRLTGEAARELGWALLKATGS